MSEITITVSGPVGCGKSAIAGEIEIAMKAIGVPVRMADEAADRSEKNMTGADWTGYLEMYEPSVVIVENITVSAAALIIGKLEQSRVLIEALTNALEEVDTILLHNPDASEPPRYRNARAGKVVKAALAAAKEISA